MEEQDQKSAILALLDVVRAVVAELPAPFGVRPGERKTRAGHALCDGGLLLESSIYFLRTPDVGFRTKMQASIAPTMTKAATALGAIGQPDVAERLAKALGVSGKPKMIRPARMPAPTVDHEERTNALSLLCALERAIGSDVVPSELFVLGTLSGSWCATVFHTDPWRIKHMPSELRSREKDSIDGHAGRFAEGIVDLVQQDLLDRPGVAAGVELGASVTARRDGAIIALSGRR